MVDGVGRSGLEIAPAVGLVKVGRQVGGEVQEADSVERLRDDEEVVLVAAEDGGRAGGSGRGVHLGSLEGRVAVEELVGPVEGRRDGDEDEK